MEWDILLHDDFAIWLYQQDDGLQDQLFAHALLLKKFGPSLGRPYVDTLEGAKHPNLKELRVQYILIMFQSANSKASAFFVREEK